MERENSFGGLWKEKNEKTAVPLSEAANAARQASA
jgi:hypothetical protein